MLGLLRRFYRSIRVVTTLLIFSAFLVVGCAIIYAVFFAGPSEKNLPDEFVLRFTLENVVEESSNDSPFRYLGKGHPIALRTFVESLERARNDKRILGLVIKAGEVDLNLAHAEEMRACLQRFKASGKYVVFYTDSFGEGGDTSALYYLASVCSQIWLQPTGYLSLTGFAKQVPFMKQLFDTVGLKAEIGQRHEFKSAPNSFLYADMPEMQRQSEERMLSAQQDQVDRDVTHARQIELNLFKNLRHVRPLTAEEAVTHKLVTHQGYWSDCLRSVKGTNLELPWIKFTDYIDTLEPIESEGQKIALIVVDGEIERGQTPPLDTKGGSTIGGDTVAKAIREAVDDEEVVAIVLRIDSPGGSHLGSDAMWYEVMQAKKSGKPIIASMGTVAASGGYFVAMAADHIIANASTITGSIGVYAGKYVGDELLKKIGVNFEAIKTSENADMMSLFKSFTPAQWDIINHQLDVTYKDFASKFQKNRNIPEFEVDRLARGRVYAGSEAISLGLVDQIGGYYDAIVHAKKLTQMSLDQPAAIQLFPRPKTLTERVMEYFEDIEDVAQFIRTTRDQILGSEKALKGIRNRVQYID